MECSDPNTQALFAGLFLVALVVVLRQRNASKKRPPGPRGWPIVGNIFDLGELPHRTLYNLRFKYGPVLWLRLGYTNTLVINTAKAAEEFYKHHDVSFAGRKHTESSTAQEYNDGALSLCPYNDYWRFIRRLVTVEIMTNKKVNDSAFVRQKCIDNMIRFIKQDSEAAIARGESGDVTITHYTFVFAFNMVGNLVFSKDLLNSTSKLGIEFRDAMAEVMDWGVKPNLADFFPILKRFDPQRIKKNMNLAMGRTFKVVETFVNERIEERKLAGKQSENKDFLDILLEHEGDGKNGTDKISSHNIYIMILEMFFGGTETTSGTIEWVMTELFRNPGSMKKVKEELNQVVGPNNKVEEHHLNQLPYLSVVIKEAMRLHPVIPLLVPRIALKDTEFMGYSIPKDTQVFVNAWGIGRDPDAWEEPNTFKPERFLNSDIDYKGQNFELLPFGSGRRMCVGLPLAHRVLHQALGTLIHTFDWELANNAGPETVDTDNEKMGFSVKKFPPLKAIPKEKKTSAN